MASHNSNMSPRQKMINLMYIVLTAMLALNVSSDVLNGFRQVEEGLVRTTENVAVQNESLYAELTTYYHNNPEKSGEWYRKATTVHKHTDSLYSYIDHLKLRIVREADGKDGDVNNIERQDDLEAASFIMLSPTTREGEKLRKALIKYSEMVNTMISDTVKQRLINEYLYPRMSKTAVGEKKATWEEANFENMPVIAAITLLTKIQSDLRSAESEILHTLLKNIDSGDVRVNQLNAYVIPSSKTVIRGGKYSANIVLAAIDDDLLNVEYKVLSFETVFFDSMGNAIPEVSDGNRFSQRQKDSFRRLSRGKRFYISRVRAIGPDGIERDLSPIEIIVN